MRPCHVEPLGGQASETAPLRAPKRNDQNAPVYALLKTITRRLLIDLNDVLAPEDES